MKNLFFKVLHELNESWNNHLLISTFDYIFFSTFLRMMNHSSCFVCMICCF